MRHVAIAVLALLVSGCVTVIQPEPVVDPMELTSVGADAQPACAENVRWMSIKPGYSRIYPNGALNQGIQGWAFVRMDIELDGTTTNEVVLYSEPGTTFDEAALLVVRTWLFSPLEERCVGIVRRVSFRIPE